MSYKRDPQAVSKNFAKNAAKQVICKNACRIQVPKFFFEHGLGEIGLDTRIFGFFPVILETGQFALVNTMAMFQIAPTRTSIITVDDVEYYEFFFAKDSVIFRTTALLAESKIAFEVLQNFFFMGRVPWYVGYDDHGKLFDTAPKFASFGAVKSPVTIEFLTAMVARKAGANNNEFLRNQIKTIADGEVGNVDWVPMSSVMVSVRSPLNKIAGAHAQDGIISAIIAPSKKVGAVERIVRA